MNEKLRGKGQKAKLGAKEIFLAIVISLLAAIIVWMQELFPLLSTTNYWVSASFFVLSVIVSLVISNHSLKNGILDNWETWSLVYAHPKIVGMAGIALTISALYAGTTQFYSGLLPLKFYLWWLSSLLAFLGVLLFTLKAPMVFKYANFRAFKEKHEDYWPIRDDFLKAKLEVTLDCDNDELDRESKKRARSERLILGKVERCGLSPNSFYIIRNRIKETSAPPALFIVLFTGAIMILSSFTVTSLLKIGTDGFCQFTIEDDKKNEHAQSFCRSHLSKIIKIDADSHSKNIPEENINVQ